MSGNDERRGDEGDGGAPVGGSDPCQKKRRGPINSPKAPILSQLTVGSVLDVDVQTIGATPILVVMDQQRAIAGSLTFLGYLEIIDCILNRGVSYEATIISISGGVYEISVEPK